MKEKIIDCFIVILIIVVAFLMYPWFVSSENGKDICSNLLGMKYTCG